MVFLVNIGDTHCPAIHNVHVSCFQPQLCGLYFLWCYVQEFHALSFMKHHSDIIYLLTTFPGGFLIDNNGHLSDSSFIKQ